MCIAIVTKAGATCTDTTIRAAASANKDGGGLAYVKDGKVVIEKGFMKVDDFLTKYHELQEQGVHLDNPMLIHFRIATTGEVGPANCHPFAVGAGDGDAALIHNGSFYGGQYNARKSDTCVVAERIGGKFLYEPTLFAKEKIGKRLGNYNKVALLYATGDYIIINEEQGAWNDDQSIWYSNSWYGGRAHSGNSCVVPLTRNNPGADV